MNKNLGIAVFVLLLAGLGLYFILSRPASQVKSSTELLSGARYIYQIDWPPETQIINKPFACTQAGIPTERAGGTTLQMINGHTYCVTEVVEGTAGSIYKQYAYAFPLAGGTAILTFSLRFIQCENYNEPEKSECEAEHTELSMDNFIDIAAQNLKAAVDTESFDINNYGK